jgi:hypothetical protein
MFWAYLVVILFRTVHPALCTVRCRCFKKWYDVNDCDPHQLYSVQELVKKHAGGIAPSGLAYAMFLLKHGAITHQNGEFYPFYLYGREVSESALQQMERQARQIDRPSRRVSARARRARIDRP